MIESVALMNARHEMESAHADVRVATAALRGAFLSIVIAVASFAGSITLDALDVITDGVAWAWGGFGTLIFGVTAVALLAFLSDENMSVVESRHIFERKQRAYVDTLDREVSSG